LIVLILLRIYY